MADSRNPLVKSGRLRPVIRVFVGLLIIVFCVMVLGIAFGYVTVLLARTGLVSERTVSYTALLVQGLGVIGGVIAARRLIDRRSVGALGLNWSPSAGRELVFGIVLGAGLQMLILMLMFLMGWASIGPGRFSTGSMFWPLLLFTVVAVNEELLMRGYIMQNLAEGLGMPVAVLMSSLFFGALHLINPHSSTIASVNIAITGVFLAAGYLVTRSLYLPIGIHLAWNFFEGPVFGFPVSGLNSWPTLLATRVSGPVVWTGGSFGPEAGLLGLVAVLVGLATIIAYSRSNTVKVN